MGVLRISKNSRSNDPPGAGPGKFLENCTRLVSVDQMENARVYSHLGALLEAKSGGTNQPVPTFEYREQGIPK